MISNDKIVGVFVDNNPTWSEHIKHLTKKIASSTWLLSKIKKFLSQDHRVQFYKSYIQPHIDFCNIVWGSSSEANKLRIFKLQKRACRVILDFNVEDSSEAMKSLKIMSIYDCLYLRKAKFMFKVYNNIAPTYFNCALLTAYLLFAIPLLLPFKKLILVLMLNKAWRNSQSKAE